MSNTHASKGTALITGASSGIGAIYADRLAARGHDLILAARNVARLEDVAGRIRAAHGRKVQTLLADLGTAEGVAAVEAVLKGDAGIVTLVNNAGFGSVAPLLNADIDDMTGMIDVNVTALTRLTYAAVPGFVARGRGTIINISSIVAIAPEILNGVYGASKAYVLALTQSLQHELADKGVRVQAVLPGATATGFFDVAGADIATLPKEWVMSSQDMVDAALAGFDQGEIVTIPPLQDGSEWDVYEAQRKAMSSHLSAAKPAPRYLAALAKSA